METKEIAVQGNELSAADIKNKIQIIQKVMKAVMKQDVHYGKIPGCPKPSLWKPGSEVLLATFRLSVEPLVEDLSSSDEAKYRVTTRVLAHDGTFLGCGIGECSSDEEKYKWKKSFIEEWEDTPEERRREKWFKAWDKQPAHKVQQIRTNVADVANTILKMAKKRSQIDATLTITGASDIFDQDLETLDENDGKPPKATKPEPIKPSAKTETKNAEQKDFILKLHELLIKNFGEDETAYLQKLKEVTSFSDKDGKVLNAGVDSLKALESYSKKEPEKAQKWARNAYIKLKKEME